MNQVFFVRFILDRLLQILSNHSTNSLFLISLLRYVTDSLKPVSLMFLLGSKVFYVLEMTQSPCRNYDRISFLVCNHVGYLCRRSGTQQKRYP